MKRGAKKGEKMFIENDTMVLNGKEHVQKNGTILSLKFHAYSHP